MDSEVPEPPAGAPPNPLPDASNEPRVPQEERYPFHGKMVSPTAVPSASARAENLRERAKAGRRRKFLIALLVGQVFVLLLDLGGEAVLHLLRKKLEYRAAFPLRTMVFIGMTGTIAAMGILLFAYLGYRAAGYVLGDRKIGFLRAVGIGLRRVVAEVWALGLILGVIGGTAWFLIPAAGRLDLQEKSLQTLHQGKAWVDRHLHPGPKP
ncbi:MAG TPA: hypothetical protein VEN81_08925 [Planctomycetota bacterium]|nr:hypothetical protein [Planctomycetota bacterium]